MRRPRMETAPRGHETLKGWSAANGPHHQCFQRVMGKDIPREESQKIWGPGGREAKTILKRQ